MTKAITFSSYGGPEVLELANVDIGSPEPGEVQVSVRAAGVQPSDCAIRRGDFAQWSPITFPSQLGNEFAGVVEAVGSGVDDGWIGKSVLGFQPLLCYSESVIVPEDQIVEKPADMPWEEAGVLSASGQTAHTALEVLGVGSGDTVLIHAAAGGVGTFAVQIAHARGATVIGTASPQNHDYLRDLGAIPVTYGEGLEERVREIAGDAGVDAALDAIGGDALDVSVHLVSDIDRVGTITDWSNSSRLGVQMIGTQRSAERLQQLVDLYEKNLLKIYVSKILPLGEAAEAHRIIETGHARGKVVLTVP